MADPEKLSHNNTYGRLPRFYVDRVVVCRNCGTEEVWPAQRQKWWYEEAKGNINTQAVLCRSCRAAERQRKETARAVSESGRLARGTKGSRDATSHGAYGGGGGVPRLFRFPGAVKRDPAVAAWMREHADDLGAIAGRWFKVMRACGDDVRELLHDGQPTACAGDAAFGYVNTFTAHVNVGFFRGAELDDPAGLLEGSGKFMRHVKLAPQRTVDAQALTNLINLAYADMKARTR